MQEMAIITRSGLLGFPVIVGAVPGGGEIRQERL